MGQWALGFHAVLVVRNLARLSEQLVQIHEFQQLRANEQSSQRLGGNGWIPNKVISHCVTTEFIQPRQFLVVLR